MLAQVWGRVSDSGEGRWTIAAAIDEAVPAPVLTTALYERFSSRGEADFQNKLLSAMRYEFGGHLGKFRLVRDTDSHERTKIRRLGVSSAQLATSLTRRSFRRYRPW